MKCIPTDWSTCGEAIYSRDLLYTMSWDVDFASKRVSCASMGGPITIMRDEREMVVIGPGSIKPVLRTFTSSGAEMGSFVWDSTGRGRVAAWGWIDTLELVIMDEIGRVSVLSMRCEVLKEFSMGSWVEKCGVAQAQVVPGAGGAIVALTRPNEAAATTGSTGQQLWVVSSLFDPRPMQLAPLPPSFLSTSSKARPGSVAMAVIEPHLNPLDRLQVILGSNGVDETLLVVDDVLAMEQKLPNSDSSSSPLGESARGITQITVSPDGSFVATLSSSGKVRVFASDFTRQLSEFDLIASSSLSFSSSSPTSPTSMVWCGSDAIVLLWSELLLLIGPFGDHATWTLDPADRMFLISEVDGLRLITQSRHELLRKVPICLSDVLRPGSTAPSAQLWDARELFDQRNAKSDRLLRGLTLPELDSATRDCIEAAGLDLDLSRQKMLLKSACLGGAFCSPASPSNPSPMSQYHDVVCKLRVLNALRASPPEGPGIPLTLTQLESITLPGVISRLLGYHEWSLAFQIAGTLNQGHQSLLGPGLPIREKVGKQRLGSGIGAPALHSPQEQVLLHWAFAKISSPSSSHLSDQDLKEQIMARFKECLPGGSATVLVCGRFAPMAAHAQSLGRYRLSLKLLEEEGSCSLQVPLLLSLSLSLSLMSSSSSSSSHHHNQHQGEEAEIDVLQRALKKAIESGDVNLVYLVLFQTFKRKSANDFWALVSSRALARNLFVKFCREREPDLLETILTVNGLTAELAEHLFRKSLTNFNTSAHQQASIAFSAVASPGRKAPGQVEALTRLTTSLAEVSNKFTASSNIKGEGVDRSLHAKASSDLAMLRREQARLERETGQSLFLGLSVVETLGALLRLGHPKQAAALRKTFGLSDRRWNWIRMSSYCELRDWEGLDEFLSEGGAVRGKGNLPALEVVLEIAKTRGAGRDIQLRIVGKMTDSVSKAELYQSLDAARDAAEVAARLKDADLFSRIQALVPTSSPAFYSLQQMQQRFTSSNRI